SYLVAKVAADLANAKGTWRIAWRFRAGDLGRCNRVAFFRHAIERLSGKLGRAGVRPGHDPNELHDQLSQLVQEAAEHQLESSGRPPRVLFVIDGLDEITRLEPGFPRVPFELTGSHVLWLCAGRPEGTLPQVFAEVEGRCSHVFAGGLPGMSPDDVR